MPDRLATAADAVHGPVSPRVLPREEAPSVRLAALARLFAVSDRAHPPRPRRRPRHRGHIHKLIERVGNQGVHTYADLRAYLPDVTPAQRRKRVLADGLPRRPGVYLTVRTARCSTSARRSTCGAG